MYLQITDSKKELFIAPKNSNLVDFITSRAEYSTCYIAEKDKISSTINVYSIGDIFIAPLVRQDLAYKADAFIYNGFVKNTDDGMNEIHEFTKIGGILK